MVVFESNPTIPISKFREELTFEFPNLPTQLFDYHLLRTAREMAEEGALIRRIAVIESEPCVDNYRLVSPDGLEIGAILSVRHSGCCSLETAVRSFVPPESSKLCGRDAIWYDDNEGVLHIPHSEPGIYFVVLGVLPSDDACELPKEFKTKFFTTLMYGTKAAILLTTGRPWTNLRVGASYKAEYDDRLREDILRTATHKIRGAVKMQFGSAM